MPANTIARSNPLHDELQAAQRPAPFAIFRRQLRALAPIPILFCMFLALRVIAVALGTDTGDRELDLRPDYNWDLWGPLGMFLALCVGVVCGAEEEENKTADLLRRLPIASARIFYEKTAASILVIAAYFVMGMGVFMIGAPMLGVHEDYFKFWTMPETPGVMGWTAMMFAGALLSAVLVRRAITAVLPAILIALGLGLLIGRLFGPHHKFEVTMEMLAWPFWIAAIALFYAARARFVRLEGK